MCGHTFVWTNTLNKYQRQRIWFERWIIEGYTGRQIAAQSGHSIRTIRRIIKHWLQHPPANDMQLSAHRHLILDGTFLDQRKGVFAVMDAQRSSVIYGASDMAEGPGHLYPFCSNLKQQGLIPVSATVDGNLHLMRIITIVMAWGLASALLGSRPKTRTHVVSALSQTYRCQTPQSAFS